MNKLWFEFRYTLRLIVKNAGHSALCVSVIAMSIGISLIVFSLVYNMLYKRMDYTDASNWVYATVVDQSNGNIEFADAFDQFAFAEMKANNRSFSSFGAMSIFAQSRFNVDERTTIFSTVMISPELLQAMNIVPHLGRSLVESDAEQGEEPVVILSYDAWQNYYAGDSDVIGKQTRLDESSYTIVGVSPKTMPFPVGFDLLMPLKLSHLTEPTPGLRRITPVGILRGDVTMAQANAELSATLTRLQHQYPDFYSVEDGVVLNPIHIIFTANSKQLFDVMGITAVMILFLGSLNIGNLLLARGLERSQEFAIRNAVGSSRWQLIRQSLLESLLLCLMGGFVGILGAGAGLTILDQSIQALSGYIPSGLPPHWDFSLDQLLVSVALLVTLGIWLVSGLIPAWSFSKPDIDETLKGAAKGATDKKSYRATKMLVSFEIVSSIFLLIICGGLLISIDHVVNADFGFTTHDRMVADMELPFMEYQSLDARNVYFERLQQEVEIDENIAQLAITSALPQMLDVVSYTVNDRVISEHEAYPKEFLVAISSNYFSVLEVPLVAGRIFDASDVNGSLPVVIVDDLFVQKTWPNETGLGKRVQLNPDSDTGSDGSYEDHEQEWYTVVGVAQHIKQSVPILGFDRVSTFYRPLAQTSSRGMSLIAQVSTPEISVLDFRASIQAGISKIDRDVALYNTKTFDRQLFEITAGFRAIADVFLWVAGLTVVLAGTGIFAIISRSVGQRVRETGIRRALGSSNADVLWIYLRQGLIYLSLGVVVGGVLAFMVGNALTGFMLDIMNVLPMVSVLVVVGMGLLICVASYLPAKKAIAMEPADALRYG